MREGRIWGGSMSVYSAIEQFASGLCERIHFVGGLRWVVGIGEYDNTSNES